MRMISIALVTLACARMPLPEPAPFEKRPSHVLTGGVADRVDPYTREAEVLRRMKADGWCARGERFVPCYRGTVARVRFLYAGPHMIGIEMIVPAPVYAAHRA